MNQILHGKNCLITGTNGGLGKEIAKEFAKNGCNLFLTGRNNEKLSSLKNELENDVSEIKIDFEDADLSDADEIQKLIEKVKSTFANIDVLVNCAGVFPVKLLSDSTVEDFENCFSVNVKAAFVLCKEFSQGMISKKWGRIVNISYTFTVLFYFYLLQNNLLEINLEKMAKKISFIQNKKSLFVVFFVLYAFGWTPQTTLRGDVSSFPGYRIPYKTMKILYHKIDNN